jgi:hypothetical protein
MVKHAGDLEDKLINLLPQLNQGFVDNPLQQQTDTNAVPAQVQITVTQRASLPGLTFIEITEPQQQLPPTAQLYSLLAARGPNAQLAPLLHKLKSSTTGAFDASSGVENYPASGQVLFTLPDTNQHWQVQSSFDSVNFNDPGPVIKAVQLP